jgi:hypothetical protein
MIWQPRCERDKTLFPALNPTQVAQMQEYARKNSPPFAHWRTLCHPVAIAIWEERYGEPGSEAAGGESGEGGGKAMTRTYAIGLIVSGLLLLLLAIWAWR